jgi:uncharacterized protein Yka (UPF0111/DUF47 family)
MRIVTGRRHIAATTLFVLLGATAMQGCGSPASSFEEQLERVASTASGATMLVEAWCEGTVPRAYALSTVERAGKNLDRISGALSATTAPSDRVQRALQEIVQLEAVMATTDEALRREDRDAARSALDVLRQLESEARRQTLAEASS